MRTEIAPSLLAADIADLGGEVRAADKAGADWIHFDVMDGHFVPNLSFGPAVLEKLRRHSRRPFDVHLMVSRPSLFVGPFARAGADMIDIHVEGPEKPLRVLSMIRRLRRKAGIVIRPRTPVKALFPYLGRVDHVLVMTVEPGFGGQAFMPEQLRKVRMLDKWRGEKGLKFRIKVDGGIDARTAPLALDAGAEILVAGTAVFGEKDYRKAIAGLRAGNRPCSRR